MGVKPGIQIFFFVGKRVVSLLPKKDRKLGIVYSQTT